MYKGNDRATIEFKACSDNGDTALAKSEKKIFHYIELCLLSASEAFYRIFARERHANIAHVLLFALHTKVRQPVLFSVKDDF